MCAPPARDSEYTERECSEAYTSQNMYSGKFIRTLRTEVGQGMNAQADNDRRRGTTCEEGCVGRRRLKGPAHQRGRGYDDGHEGVEAEVFGEV